MTSSDAASGLTGLSGLDPTSLHTLTATARRLAHDYDTTFEAVEVGQVLADSYRLLARTARVTVFLPTLAERLTRERLEALAATRGLIPKRVPEVLFVCVHNAGRSQMAAALTRHYASTALHIRTGGSDPGTQIHPEVIAAMKDIGLSLDEEFPKPLTDDILAAADVVITMGCGDRCPYMPGKRYEDWPIDDPATASVDQVAAIRDDIDHRVRDLVASLLPDQALPPPRTP
ncbi:arsenate reductase ArsC [Frankia sp. AgB1.9]|uniref:arsenate reductase/protein-tyrosine-phosphatase family protein n=1 Tax=unclassified Frankia TaxID=2632575 RepID=UPI001933095C|nr:MULTISPECIES: arsenate reductase ArsC [unclassified Frankia]MBL7486710.1 arsenate reductase ArsC [Frankia sp. AgW1.1]MBL7554082.1 arsenate reductase ArsC [Frankia sp. AgB1.9]MBL7618376.1 arsenate reductase ArsC [Frankia sp. AgB1.8]